MKSRQKNIYRKMEKIKQSAENEHQKKENKNRFIAKFLNNKLAVLGLILFIVIVFMCTFPKLFTSYNPSQIQLTIENYLKPPSRTHIFGTDKLGRDVFSSILYGGFQSIQIGLVSALFAGVIGVSLGCFGGYRGGLIDKSFMRLSELMTAFPRIVLVMLLVSIIGRSKMNLLMIFGLTGWSTMYRLTRARVLSLREKEFVQALKAFSVSDNKIAFKHILPNAIGPIAVNFTLSTANFILQETSLSFLGVGISPEILTWGNMINVAKELAVFRSNVWLWLPVGIFMSLFILSINFIGDGFRDASDTSQQG